MDEEDKQSVMLGFGADSQNGNVPIGQTKTTIINESGLYSLIMSSKLPSAKKFKRWVTSEVLPALKKTGTYTMPGKEKETKQYFPTRPLTTDDYMTAAKTIARCVNERLPIVIDAFEKAGLSLKKIQETAKLEELDDLAEFRNLIAQYTFPQLEKILPICRTSVYYYHIGASIPKQERMKQIIKILREDGEQS